MALFVLKEGFQVESSGTGGRVVHVRTGDALDLSAPEVQLLARATVGGVDSQDVELRPLLKKLARMGLLVPASGKVGELEASLQPAPAGTPAPPLDPGAVVPLFRRDLQVTRKPDSEHFLVTDLGAKRTFALYDFELSLARMLNGKRKVAEVLEAGERLGIPVTLDSLSGFIRQLARYGFLVPPGAPAENPGIRQPREEWDPKLRELYQNGLRLSRQGQHAEAAPFFEAMLEQDPKNPEALERLAQVRQRLGQAAPAAAESFLAPPADDAEEGGWAGEAPSEGFDAEVPTLLFSGQDSEPQVAEAGPAALSALEDAAAAALVPIEDYAAIAGAETPAAFIGLEEPAAAPAAEAPVALEDWAELAAAEAPAPLVPLEEAPVAAPAAEPAAGEGEEIPVDDGAEGGVDVAVDTPPVETPYDWNIQPNPVAVAAAHAPAPVDSPAPVEATFFDSPPPARTAAEPEASAALPMAMPERLHDGGRSSRLPLLLAAAAAVALAFAGGWQLGFRSGQKGAAEALAARVAVAPEPAVQPPPEPVKPVPAEPAEPAVAAVAAVPPVEAQAAVDAGAAFVGEIPPADPIDSKDPEGEGEKAAEPAAPVAVAAVAPVQPAVQEPPVKPVPDAVVAAAAEPAVDSVESITVAIAKRGRVTMCMVTAPEDGAVAWKVQAQQRIRKGQAVGTVGSAALATTCGGLLIPLVDDKGAAAAGESLADVVYHEGFLQTLVPGKDRPEPSWGCEAIDEGTGEKAGCKVVQAAPKAGGFFITATYEPMWLDTAEKPKLRLTPR